MEIDFFGNITLAKLILPYFQVQKTGKFVVISSIAGKFGFYLRSSYSAAKHALHGFYESLRLEEEKNNLSVTIICPGKINTPISTNALGPEGEKYGVMDHNQDTGMSVETCVEKILQAVSKNKKEILIGNKEIIAVYLKRYFPRIFYKIIRKQSAV
jgi:short-subunit dehydrogenase